MARLTEKSITGNILTARIVKKVIADDTRVLVETPEGIGVALRKIGGIKNVKDPVTVAGEVFKPVDLENATSNQKFVLSVFQMNILEKDSDEEAYAACLSGVKTPLEFGKVQVSPVNPVPRVFVEAKEHPDASGKVFDDAYAEAIKTFSLTLKGVPDTDKETGGIMSVLSDGCGGSGLAYISGVDMRSKFARDLKKWALSNPGERITVEGKSLNFYGMKPDPKIYVAKKGEYWKEVQCVTPRVKAYSAFLDYVRKKGVDVGCAYVKTYID